MNTTYIYLIRDYKSNAVKIGRSDNPAKRVAELQTGNPYPLELLYSFSADPSLEQIIHKELQEYALSGEWFQYCDEVVDVYFGYLTGGRYRPEYFLDEALELLKEYKGSVDFLVALVEKTQQGWQTFSDKVEKDTAKLKETLKQQGVDI